MNPGASRTGLTSPTGLVGLLDVSIRLTFGSMGVNSRIDIARIVRREMSLHEGTAKGGGDELTGSGEDRELSGRNWLSGGSVPAAAVEAVLL
jgi:hypothetical protein